MAFVYMRACLTGDVTKGRDKALTKPPLLTYANGLTTMSVISTKVIYKKATRMHCKF